MRHALALLLPAALLAGCGDGSGERQDADEPAGALRVEVVRASFPARQALGAPATLAVRVRNAEDAPLRRLAVTLETPGSPLAFSQAEADPSFADPARAVWVLDRGPQDADTAYVNTWAVGPLGPGEARTLRWELTPVRAGRFSLRYRVAPGLDGRARAMRPRPPAHTAGALAVRVSARPRAARVDGRGRVVREGDTRR